MILSAPTPKTSAASRLLLLRFNNSQTSWIYDPQSELVRPVQYEPPLPGSDRSTYPDHVSSRNRSGQFLNVVHENLVIAARMEFPRHDRTAVSHFNPSG